jgi:colanic acid/amylovoran biosynthesis protein
LTVANLAIVAEECRKLGIAPHFTLFGMRDGDCPSVVGPDVAVATMTMRYLLAPGGYSADLATMDLMIDIGAGDSFADIYAAKRFFMIWTSKYLTVRRKLPLILAPQTIGPFTGTIYKRLAGWIMTRSTAVVARDRKSLAVARDLAPHATAMLAADVAFSLPFADRSADRGANRPGTPARVGINVSGLLFTQAETGENRFGLSFDYAAFIRQLIDTLSSRDDVELLLVTHAISGGDATDDDDAIANRMAAEFPATVRVPNFIHPSEAKSFISSLDFLVASRMHACIAAFSSGVPVMPVAYSRKFEGVFGLLGYTHLVPVQGIDQDAAVVRIVSAFDDRGALAADIARGTEQVGGLLDTYRALLSTEITRAAAR